MFRRPEPLLIVAICAGIAGFTISEALGLPELVGFVVTVLAVFAVAVAMRSRGR